MGIDAEILIRYRGERPTDEQLNRWSWDLCRALGADKFFINDGLPPDQYHEACAAWHAAFNAHDQHPRWNAGDHAARDAIVADIGEAPQCLRRAIELTHRIYPLGDDSDIPTEFRKPGLAWTQDGDPILAQPGEWFMKVGLWTRYYGEGYERGDLMTICAVAEWIEANMQPCEVWYGGDSSGVCVEPLTETRRAELKRHFFGRNGRDYYKYGQRSGSFPTPAPCGLCVHGENRFNRHGWGGDYIAVNCAGCGVEFTSRDSGATWQRAEPQR